MLCVYCIRVYMCTLYLYTCILFDTLNVFRKTLLIGYKLLKKAGFILSIESR